jgi:hypothetical protein
MLPRLLIGAGVLLLIGCQQSREPDRRIAPHTSNLENPWVPSLSIESAKSYTPEEAKAILIARAAVENQAKESGGGQPEIMGFNVSHVQGRWSVYIQFVGIWDNDKPIPAPSFFTVVNIDAEWKVTSIVGGA